MLLVATVFFFLGISSISYLALSRMQEKQRMKDRLQALSPSKANSTEKDLPDNAKPSRLRQTMKKLGSKLPKDQAAKMDLQLQRADIPLRGSEFLLINLATGIAPMGLVLLDGDLMASHMLSMVGAILPKVYLRMKQGQRSKALASQIPDALVMVSNALKAGYSFLQALELISQEMAAPIATEFGRVLKDINLGLTTEEALDGMVERANSDDLDLVVTAVMIQRQVGGNLSEILDSTAFTIRERIRIKGEIKTLTAQGRMSGIVISGLPVGLGFVIYLMNPEYMSLLFTEPIGQMMIGVSVIGEIIAIILIRKIVDINV